MTIGKGLAKLGAAAGAAVAALALLTAPEVSAATSAETVRLTGPTDFTANSEALASCSNDLSGPVTSHNDSTGESVANIDNAAFDCSHGTTSITARPWTLHLFGNDAFTLDGFDVNVTTSQGTCRYTGDVEGAFQFPGGIDDIRISMTRHTAGCGWPQQVSGFGFPESVTRSSATRWQPSPPASNNEPTNPLGGARRARPRGAHEVPAPL